MGAVWTRWSTYNSLNIYMDNGNQSISHKNWQDGWNFNASVEYKPLDWWSLRAGFWYETLWSTKTMPISWCPPMAVRP